MPARFGKQTPQHTGRHHALVEDGGIISAHRPPQYPGASLPRPTHATEEQKMHDEQRDESTGAEPGESPAPDAPAPDAPTGGIAGDPTPPAGTDEPADGETPEPADESAEPPAPADDPDAAEPADPSEPDPSSESQDDPGSEDEETPPSEPQGEGETPASEGEETSG